MERENRDGIQYAKLEPVIALNTPFQVPGNHRISICLRIWYPSLMADGYYHKSDDSIQAFETRAQRTKFMIENLTKNGRLGDRLIFNAEGFEGIVNGMLDARIDVFMEDDEGYSLGILGELYVTPVEGRIAVRWTDLVEAEWASRSTSFSSFDECMKAYASHLLGGSH